MEKKDYEGYWEVATELKGKLRRDPKDPEVHGIQHN